MKRDPISGDIDRTDLLKFCREVNDDADAEAHPPVKGPDHIDPTWLRQLKERQKPTGFLEPMNEAELIESLVHTDGAFVYVDRLSPEEIRKRQEAREKGPTPSRSWLIP